MSAIYIHVPFCQRKCPYCAFYSEPGASPDLLDRYVDSVLQEVALRPWPWDATTTLFLGGGTPTMLGPNRIQRLLQALPHSASWLPHAEVSMEANPGTLLVNELAAYRQAGVNRLSVGVQSLSDTHLRFLNRIHNAADALRTLEAALDAGFRTSADLMYGLPRQSLPSFQRQVRRLVELGVTHLSCYLLSAEEHTPLLASVQRGEVHLPSHQKQADWVAATHALVSDLGWHLYEVSSAAATPDEACRHNLVYWRRQPYLGLGPAAHSFDGKRRRGNAPSVSQWLEALESGRQPPHFEETLSHQQHVLELLMLGLRVTEGLDPAQLWGHCTQQGREAITLSAQKYQMQQYVRLQPNRWYPTSKGLLFADALPVWILDEAENAAQSVYLDSTAASQAP